MGLGFGLSGVKCSDTAWGTSEGGQNAVGSFMREAQVNLARDAGCKVLNFQINWWAWATNNSQNILGLPFRDYLKELCNLTRNRNMLPVLALSRSDPTYDPAFPWQLRRDIIRGVPVVSNDVTGYWAGLQDPQGKWLQFGKEMIRYCDPWGIDAMDEHTGVVSFEEWRTFQQIAIKAFRDENPNIHCFVEGTRAFNRSRLDEFMQNPLPFSNITYKLHRYHHFGYDGWAEAFKDGDIARGRNLLFSYYDSLFHVGEPNTLYPDVGLTEWGAYDYDPFAYWDDIAQAHYDYFKTRDVFNTLYGFTKRKWNVLTNDHMNLNPAGQIMAANLRPTTPQCYTDADCPEGQICSYGRCVPAPTDGNGQPQQPNLIPLVILVLLGLVGGVATFGGD